MFVFSPLSLALIDSFGWSDALVYLGIAMLIVPLLALTFTGYFAWHGWHGSFGMEARRRLAQEADRLDHDLARAKAERAAVERRVNLLDGGAHFYDTYQCADGKWISIGSIEPQFYALLLEKTGINDPEFAAQMDRASWDSLRDKLGHVIAQKTQAEWCEIMDATDVCFAPVLDLDEAPKHAHNVARKTFVELEGVIQPAPAPRFSATPGAIQGPPPAIGAHDMEALGDWGFSPAAIDALKASGALAS